MQTTSHEQSPSQDCHQHITSLILCAIFIALPIGVGHAQSARVAHQQINRFVDENAANWKQVSKEIWGYAELGYYESKSSSLLQTELRFAGFTVQSGVADEPTAFIASFGHGKPVIATLGEFDALPGLSQQTLPDRAPVVANAPGHGCGHNLLGAGAALAAVSVKKYLGMVRSAALDTSISISVSGRSSPSGRRAVWNSLASFHTSGRRSLVGREEGD